MERIVVTVVMLGLLFGLSYGAGMATKSGIEIFDMKTDVAVVRIHGAIGMPTGMFSTGAITSEEVREMIDEALSSPMVGALVIEVDSGGGTAAETELIAKEIERARESVPVVAYVPELAASGGYWIASEAEEIFVSPLAMTGSIGVYSQFVNASGLYEKIGIEMTTIKSGEYKDMGDPSRGLTAEEEEMMQELSDYVYLQFVDAVAENRGMTREEMLPLAKGAIFVGEQNVENGLADRVGYLEDAVARAGELAEIENPRTIVIEQQVGFEEMFMQMSSRITGSLLSGTLSSGWRIFT